jgi:hypothetical protein
MIGLAEEGIPPLYTVLSYLPSKTNSKTEFDRSIIQSNPVLHSTVEFLETDPDHSKNIHSNRLRSPDRKNFQLVPVVTTP